MYLSWEPKRTNGRTEWIIIINVNTKRKTTFYVQYIYVYMLLSSLLHKIHKTPATQQSLRAIFLSFVIFSFVQMNKNRPFETTINVRLVCLACCALHLDKHTFYEELYTYVCVCVCISMWRMKERKKNTYTHVYMYAWSRI